MNNNFIDFDMVLLALVVMFAVGSCTKIVLNDDEKEHIEKMKFIEQGYVKCTIKSKTGMYWRKECGK